MEQGLLREGFGVELYSRVQLRAVFSGVAIAISTLALLVGLSWAIGLSTFKPTASGAHGLALGVIIWGAIALALSILVGAYVAALVGRSGEARDGILHGLVVWGTLGAVLFFAFLSLFSGIMHDLLIATGGARNQLGQAPRLDDYERAILAQAARSAASILWIYWAGVISGLVTAVIGGWLGARAEQTALVRHTEKERPPIGPVLPQPTGA